MNKWVIPFNWSPPLDPFIVINAEVGDIKNVNLVVDTGLSAGVILDKKFAENHGIQLGECNPQQHLNKITLRITESLEIRIREHHGDHIGFRQCIPVHVGDISSLIERQGIVKWDGLLGAGFFSNKLVQFDFINKRLVIRALQGLTLPSINPSNHPYKCVRCRSKIVISGQSCSVIIDTGARSSIIHNSILSVAVPTHETRQDCWLFSGLTSLPFVELTEFSLGRLKLPKIIVGLVESENHAIIGLDLLPNFDIELDFSSGIAYLIPRDNKARQWTPGRAGAQLDRFYGAFRKGLIVVRNVIPDHAASRAGIKKGDLLMSIDNHSIHRLNVIAATRFLDGYAGEISNIIYERNGKSHETILIRPSFFD